TEELNHMRESLIECSKCVFEGYSSLEDMYQREIVPMLNGERELPQGGMDWYFESLALCKIVAPENYPRLKEILLQHAEYRMQRKEPNMEMYYPRLDEILTYLENYDFKV
ncbi:MAG: hypothetical protein K2K93_12175, partial [Muribaculaceae bacterium]|nr:hypothetical protein [Muribaculaceae bacterium]